MNTLDDIYNERARWDARIAQHRRQKRRSAWKAVGLLTISTFTSGMIVSGANYAIEYMKSPEERQDEAYMFQRRDWFQSRYRQSMDTFIAGKNALDENDPVLARKYFLQAKGFIQERKAGCPATDTYAAKDCRDVNDSYISTIDKHLNELNR